RARLSRTGTAAARPVLGQHDRRRRPEHAQQVPVRAARPRHLHADHRLQPQPRRSEAAGRLGRRLISHPISPSEDWTDMSGKGNAILVVEVELPEEDIDEFNRWYREEHGPFKLALPGYLGLRRFRAQDGSARFLALYELETAAAADDPGPMSPEDIATMQK